MTGPANDQVPVYLSRPPDLAEQEDPCRRDADGRRRRQAPGLERVADRQDPAPGAQGDRPDGAPAKPLPDRSGQASRCGCSLPSRWRRSPPAPRRPPCTGRPSASPSRRSRWRAPRPPGRSGWRPRRARGRPRKPRSSAGSRPARRRAPWPARRQAPTIQRGHPDHADLLQAVQGGARQRDAAGHRRSPRGPGTRSTTTRSCSGPRATATASAPTSCIGLPKGVNLVGSHPVGDPSWGTWKVPAGSTARLQQLLAVLGYLPLRFTYAGSPARALDRRPGGRGGQGAGRQLQLALPEHPERAPTHVGAGHVRRDDQGRDHGLRERQRPHRRRGPGARALEGADHRRGREPQQHLRLHVRAGQRGQPREPVHVAQRQDCRVRAGQHRVSRRRRPRRACSPCSSTRRR